ncbi:TadE/TadG family type IV pilus assembly protein [Ornithinimicrobium murale]|uniref:TadE/TadG family type IV pilus assembly protein n=1 Tax=Ornithinimicrobium murale TaxID=1050153 RepID=UPI000E0D0576
MSGVRVNVERRQCERGAAAVEFALVAIVLITMILGVVEFGRLWAVQGSLAQAARDAARTYAITDDPATVQPAFLETFAWLAPGTESSLSINPSPLADGEPGDVDCRRTVTASYAVSTLTGFLGDSWNLTAEGSMRCNG